MPALEDPLLQSRYNIYVQNARDPLPEGITLPGKDLLKPEALRSFLSAFAEAVGSPRGEVTGSLFIKRYVSLIAGAVYAFTFHNRGLDISLENVKLVLKKEKLLFTLQSQEEPGPVSRAGSREERRKGLLHHIYHTNLKPVWSVVIEATGINGATLWATMSYLLAYWKEADLRDAESGELQHRIGQDYRFITDNAWDESFTDCPINPIYSRFEEAPVAGETVLVRAKCCLQYCLPGEDRYCYTCPRISEEERLRKYSALH